MEQDDVRHPSFRQGDGGSHVNQDFIQACFSRKYDIQIIDRVGGGDSFGVGLIYGLVTGKRCQDIIEFAVAASCLKQTIEGDYNRTSVADVESLLKNGGSGRVLR